MDVSDISKVANRKRMNADAEKLREKVSRETAKIIKLKVAQDTAYWDVKEKLAQTESGHERLRRNMLEVQMRLEAASADHERELRLRPDTLNRVAAARDTCALLEAHAERLRTTVTRVRADRAALAEAYGAAARRVDAADAQHRDRLRAATARLERAAAGLAAQRARAEELGAARAELRGRLSAAERHAQRRDEELRALQAETRRLLGERDARDEAALRKIAAHDREMKVAREALSALEAELGRQRELTHGARREAELLRDQAATEQRRAADTQRELSSNLQNAQITIERLTKQLEDSVQARRGFEETIAGLSERVTDVTAEAERLRENLARAEAVGRELEDRLNETKLECASRTTDAEETARVARALEERIAENENSIETLKSAEREAARRLEEAAGGAARLLAELRAAGDARARAEAEAAAAGRRAEAERRAADGKLAAKEDELAAQMKIILEMRGEKERLQEKIRGMRATIDNVQKELTGRAEGAEGADGAAERPHERSAPPAPELYDFFSDGSIDGIDAAEVNRRLEALALGRVTPRPVCLAQMKKDLKTKSRRFFKNKRLQGTLQKTNK